MENETPKTEISYKPNEYQKIDITHDLIDITFPDGTNLKGASDQILEAIKRSLKIK